MRTRLSNRRLLGPQRPPSDHGRSATRRMAPVDESPLPENPVRSEHCSFTLHIFGMPLFATTRTTRCRQSFHSTTCQPAERAIDDCTSVDGQMVEGTVMQEGYATAAQSSLAALMQCREQEEQEDPGKGRWRPCVHFWPELLSRR